MLYRRVVRVKAAFFFTAVFPPPASCPEFFPGSDCSGAGGTANAYKSFAVKRVDWYLVLVDGSFHFLVAPVQQGMNFREIVCSIPFNGLHGISIG